MTGCRIGKVKFKSGGEISILPEFKEHECAWVFKNALSEIQGKEVSAAGYFIITNSHSFSNYACDGFHEASGGAQMLHNKIMDDWKGNS